MNRLQAVLQIVLALILFLFALATLVNMALIAMKTEATDTISVINTIIGQTVLIVFLVALGRILLRKGVARYSSKNLNSDNASTKDKQSGT